MNENIPVALSLRELVIDRGSFRLGPISLNVERSTDSSAGSIVWCRGPNGSGKSTLLLTIAGLLEPTSGAVEVDGREWTSAHPPHARDVGLLLQGGGLFPHLTIRQQCELVPGSDSERLVAGAERLDITQRLDRRPKNLSGGEAQRCALLRTLVRPVRLLLLDEPLAAQHEEGRQRVIDALSAERARGAVVLVASHLELPHDLTLDL